MKSLRLFAQPTLFIVLMVTAVVTACGGGRSISRSASGPPPQPTPDFSVSITSTFSSTSVSLEQGGTSTPLQVSIVGLNGFSGSVSLTLLGLPAGTTADPALPVTVIANSSQTLSLHCSPSTPVGDSALTFYGSSSSASHDATITLSINPPVLTSQSGTVLYMESYASGHTARIGLETAWGGSIVELSLDGTNFVNRFDNGREVQPALYDGADYYDDCAGCTGAFGWDPVLGGDHYGHGSPVLIQRLASDSLYVKTQPLQWYPDDKGGGPSTPVLADAYFEQTVSVVAGAPLAFDVHYRLTHFGTDQHYNDVQEFPAVYVNSSYATLLNYGGTVPWTGDAVTRASVPALPGALIQYSAEHWAAYVDSNNVGLSVFSPASYPYVIASWLPGSGGAGPTASATYYQRPLSVSTINPNSVLEGDVYLIPGDATAARDVIYGLHQLTVASDVFSPKVNVDTPTNNAILSGQNVQISGWAFDDTAVSSVTVYIDNELKGNAVYGISRPDVATTWPHAPTQCGWTFSLDSTSISNGSHTITLHVNDTSNNESIAAPISVTIIN